MSLEHLRLTELLALGRDRAASDLHVGTGAAPSLRINGRIVVLDVTPFGAATLEAFLAEETVRARPADGTVDVVLRSGVGAPYRLHAYRTMDGPRLAFRYLATGVPDLGELALPPIVASFATHATGLLLFTGPTGSGKTTALAALVDRINRTAERVILSVEDPVEYVHAPVRSVLAHCAVGDDVASYAAAVHGFMRADPDVIVIGELRDRETMDAALTAAETGHLVLATLHTADSAQTVDRIVDAFPHDAEAQVRGQLAATLLAIVSLRLVPTLSSDRRVAAAEVLVATDAVRAMIRDGKTHQLRNAVLTGRAAGMVTLEASLSDLVVRGVVGIDSARALAQRPTDVQDLVRAAG